MFLGGGGGQGTARHYSTTARCRFAPRSSLCGSASSCPISHFHRTGKRYDQCMSPPSSGSWVTSTCHPRLNESRSSSRAPYFQGFRSIPFGTSIISLRGSDAGSQVHPGWRCTQGGGAPRDGDKVHPGMGIKVHPGMGIMVHLGMGIKVHPGMGIKCTQG